MFGMTVDALTTIPLGPLGHFLAQVPASQPVYNLISADEVLSPYIYVFYAAFIVSFIFTPIMRRVAIYYNIIDQPDRIRKLHAEPVAYLGGVAVFLGWMAGLAISQFTQMHRREIGLPLHLQLQISIVIGAALIVCLGLWDDVKGASPRIKIFLQIMAATALLQQNIGTHCIEPLLTPLAIRLEPFIGIDHNSAWFHHFSVFLSSGLVIAIVVGCCNASNLMDGLDGLCGGVTAIIAAGFVFVAVHMAMNGRTMSVNNEATRVVLGLALLGGVLGFVPYNFNPASIFMGDTGSMFLGYSCATMIILMAEENPKWFLASMVMFSLPVLDTSLAFARRFVNGRPLFSADRHHFHHQMMLRGYTVKQTVLISYALALCFAILGILIVFVRTRYAIAIYLVVFGSIIVAAFKMGMVHERRVVIRANLREGENQASGMQPDEQGSVLEIREPEKNSIETPAPLKTDEPARKPPEAPPSGVWTEPA